MKRRITRNHNFTHHQIGSVTKPLFALTMAMDPYIGDEVLQTKIKCHGDNGRYVGKACEGADPIEGYPLGCFKDERHGDVDFPTYFARSCHRFQFHLGARALKLLVPQLDGQTLCDQAQLGAYFDNLDDNTPFGRWRRYFGASWNLRDWQEAYKYAGNVWSTVNREVDHVFGGLSCPTDLSPDSQKAGNLATAVQDRFARLGPPTVYFKGSGFNKCPGDYGSWLKGGGTNRWSNLLIAQALARVATGSRVEAHLDKPPTKPSAPVHNVGPVKQIFLLEKDERFAQVRGLILKGMGMVMTDGHGTAKRVEKPIRLWLDRLQARTGSASRTGSAYGVYAKTGTSDRKRLVTVWDSKKQKPKTVKRWLKEANFAMIVARCEPTPGLPYIQGSLACSKVPAPGQPWKGVVIYFWVEDLGGAQKALGFFKNPEGKEFLNEVTTYLAKRDGR